MGYLGVTVVVAALVVLITFGSFGQLSRIQVKSVWLLLAGLAIQIANGRGLLPRLEAIDALLDETPRTLSLESARALRRPGEPARKSA